MTNPGREATLIGIAANALLFTIKLFGGLITGSLALMSDALNSFSDTAYSVAVFIAVRVSHQKADKDHPFGHHRAEPVAGLLIAILAGIIGFEIIKEGAMGLMLDAHHIFSLLGVGILLASMSIKAFMWLYFRNVARRIRSPAIHASAIDSRNDILISLVALFGFSAPILGFAHMDSYAGMLIGLFIIWSGYRIGVENIDYLMGKAPRKEILDEIYKRASKVQGVRGVHDVRAHYVGNYLHVQVHIEVDKDLHTDVAHAIGKGVQKSVEGMPSVDNAFIHIDPR